MNKSRIVLFGNGQMAETAHVYLAYDSPYEVVAFAVDADRIQADAYRGLPLVAFEDLDKRYPPEGFGMFIPMSAKAVNTMRQRKYEAAKARGYRLVSYVSPRAMVCPETSIGDNCFIFEGNVIQPFARIGNNCILWSGNHIGHHSAIGNHCFLASHIVISGRCTVGNNCYFGVNSTVRDGVAIASRCIIGAGALIMRDTEEGQVYMGLPGKRISQSADSVDII
jgi:sugar O-acyltransferase (sialic acid O-acetyltransferase NeuD family)